MLGITNLTKDGKWIVFMDFDGFQKDWLDCVIPQIQKLYFLSDAYLFQSSEHGFHIVTFDKFDIHTLVNILRSASCDPNYVFVPLKYGLRLWTLRQNEKKGEKPKFIKIYKAPHRDFHSRSLAHMIAFEKIYNLKIDKTNHDSIEDFVVVSGYEIA
jgi:hypothetical protein